MLRLVRTSLAAASLALALAGSAPAQTFAAGDPLTKEEFVAGLLDRLTSHEFFSRVVVVQDRSFEPLLFLVQKPQVETPDFVAKAVGARGPWLRKLSELFQRQYVEPLGLKRRSDTPLTAVAVLQTLGDYTNYLQKIRDLTPTLGGANYERRLRTTVMYDQGFVGAETAHRSAELAAFVRGLLQAHYNGSGGEVEQAWIHVGLGGYLGAHTGGDPAALDVRTIAPRQLETLAAMLRDPPKRATYLQPLERLAGLGGYASWRGALEGRGRAGVAQVEDVDLLSAWYAQSVLWMHFLHDADGGKHRKHVLAYIASALGGAGDAAALRKAFEGADLAALDREFYAWFAQRWREAHPEDPLDAQLVADPFGAPAADTGTGAGGGAPRAAVVAALAVPDSDLMAAHGRALQVLRSGRVEEALATLEKLVRKARGGPLERRLEREIVRAKAWIALRDAFFADAIASGEKLSFELAGKKVVAKVARVEQGRVFFGENRQKVESAPLEQFRPYDVARALPKALADAPAGWIKLYPLVLEGKDKPMRVDDWPELDDLCADAQEWYPGVLRLGAAVQALDALAAAGVPKDANSVQACLDGLRALRSTWGDLQIVAERSQALQQFAAAALAAGFDVLRLPEQFAGRFELLGDGRARITYEFDDPKELGDWVKQPGYLSDWYEEFPPTAKTEAQSTLAVAGGAALGTGVMCYRLPLVLREPLVARYSVRYGKVPPGGSDVSAETLVVCDDGKGRNIGVAATGCLRVSDPETVGVLIGAPPPVPFDVSHDYAVELRVAGKLATALLDGQQVAQLEIGTRTRGEVALAVHSDCEIRFQRVEVEGLLDVDAARKHWIETRLAALGF